MKIKGTRAPRRYEWWHVALIVLTCFFAFANTISGEFVWDDEIQIVRNEQIRAVSIARAFTTPVWQFASADRANHTNYFRPIQTLLYSLGYHWAGLSPVPGHIINLSLHVLAAIFVYWICIELPVTPGIALIAAMLFSVHPIHSEAVAWIGALPDVACGAFYFGAFWMFLKSDYGLKWKWLLGSALLFLLALFSKEMAVSLPALILLLLFREGTPRMATRQWILLGAPYAASMAVYLALRTRALGFIATQQNHIQTSVFDTATLGIAIMGQYLRLVLLPFDLSAFYMVPLHFPDRFGSTLFGFAILATLVCLAWRYRRIMPDAWIALAAFVIALSPVFYFPGISGALMAERYLYVPSLIPIVFLTISAAKGPPRNLWIVWGLIVLFGFLTIWRNQIWHDPETLYTQTLKSHLDVAHFRLGFADILLKRDDDAGARSQIDAAIMVLNSGKYLTQEQDNHRAVIGLGVLEARAGHYAEAKERFLSALRLSPGDPWPYVYLGGIAIRQEEDFPRAIEYLTKAIELDPILDLARDYMGIALFNSGRIAEATAQFEAALQINPYSRDARLHLNMSRTALQKVH